MTTLSDVMLPEIRRTPFAFENLAFALVFLVAAKTAFREKVEVREGKRREWRSANPHASSLWLSAAKQSNFVCATMINALGLNDSLFAQSKNQLLILGGEPNTDRLLRLSGKKMFSKQEFSDDPMENST